MRKLPIVNATTARQNFFELMNTTIEAREPVYVTGKQGNIVMISEEDYRAMQETIYLNSIPAVREKIIRGLAVPLSECIEDDDED